MPSSIEYVPGGLSKPRVTVNTAKVEPARLSAAAEEFVPAGSTASQEPRAATPPRAVVADESGEAEGVPAVLDVVAVAPKGVWGLGGGLTAPERLRLAEEEERERLREEEENRLALEAAKEEETKSKGDGGLVRVHEWGVERQDLDRLSDNATHAQDASSRSAFGGIPVGGVEEMQLGFEVVHSAALRGRSMSDVHRGGDDEGWQRARSRQRSLSPRMRFYGDDDGNFPRGWDCLALFHAMCTHAQVSPQCAQGKCHSCSGRLLRTPTRRCIKVSFVSLCCQNTVRTVSIDCDCGNVSATSGQRAQPGGYSAGHASPLC